MLETVVGFVKNYKEKFLLGGDCQHNRYKLSCNAAFGHFLINPRLSLLSQSRRFNSNITQVLLHLGQNPRPTGGAHNAPPNHLSRLTWMCTSASMITLQDLLAILSSILS